MMDSQPGCGSRQGAVPSWAPGLGIVLVLLVWVLALTWPLVNPAGQLDFRDIPRLVLPNFALVVQALREGFFPLIDLRKGAGMPFLHDPQTGAWYPLTWVMAGLGVEDGFRVFQVFHLFWLGLGFACLGRKLTSNFSAALLAGITATGAVPHLLALEWMHMTAGLSWVPWILLAGAAGSGPATVLGLVLLFSTGHAYLWVGVPVLAVAAFLLCPVPCRRPLLLGLLLLPLLTWPFWGGYLDLSGLTLSHGFDRGVPPPVVAFSPKHALGFVIPEAFRSFRYQRPDGAWETVSQFAPFSWTRKCYLGILPLLLIALSWPSRRHSAWTASLWLGGAGVFLAGVLPLMAPLFPEGFRHMFHPASFIGFTVMAAILLATLGWTNLGEPGLPMARPRYLKGFALASGVFGVLLALGAILADRGLVDPIWGHWWRVGWQAPLLGLAFSGIGFGLLAWSSTDASGRMFHVMLGVLLVLHAVEVFHQGRAAVPFSPTEPSPFSAVGRELPAGSARVFTGNDLIMALKQASGACPAHLIPVFFQFLKATGVPNLSLVQGPPQLGAYNPPFFHPGVQRWLGMLESLPPGDRDLFLLLSHVRFVLGPSDFTAGEGWKLVGEVAFPGLLGAKLWDLGPSFTGCLIDAEGLKNLDAGRSPGFLVGLGEEQCHLEQNRLRYELPERTAGCDRLFLPWAPLPGWRVRSEDQELAFDVRTAFGLVLTVPPEVDRLEVWYEEPFLARRLAGALLGLVALVVLWVRCRSRGENRQGRGD